MKKQSGMTLVEVMVALAILATAASVITHGITSEMRSFSNRKMKVIASWVAQNQMNETIIMTRGLPKTGTTRGKAENADIEWFWEQKVTKADYQGIAIRRIEVTVKDREDAEEGYAFLTALVGDKP